MRKEIDKRKNVSFRNEGCGRDEGWLWLMRGEAECTTSFIYSSLLLFVSLSLICLFFSFQSFFFPCVTCLALH